jgi:hypothetical protein
MRKLKLFFFTSASFLNVNIASVFGRCIKSGLSDVTESSHATNYKKKNEGVL